MPFILVNVWELMRHYNVWQLGIALVQWKAAESATIPFNDFSVPPDKNLPVPREMIEEIYSPLLSYTESECKQLELDAALGRCEKISFLLKYGLTWGDLITQAKVLREAIEGQLRYRRFAFVQAAKAKILDEFRGEWETVLKKFPNTQDDIEHAVECYALEQNTACVFHLMRVTEYGLRTVAKRVGVKLTDKGKPQPIEFATWEKVIAAIKNKIAAAHGLSRGLRRKQQLQFYSDAADQCTYIRDIWRNEVAHTRGSYNDGEALGVIIRVRQFMELLATS